MRKSIVLVGVVLLALSMFVVASAESAGSATVSQPIVSSFSASPSNLPDTGGPVALSAHIADATSCSFSSSPAVAGLPVTVKCSKSTVSHGVNIPDDRKKVGIKYTFSMVASNSPTSESQVMTAVVTVAPQSSPSPGSIAGVRSVVGTNVGACALLQSGGVDCWGDNTDGQLGNGSTGGPDNGGYDTAQSVVGITNAVGLTDLSFDDHYSYCAVLISGGVACWGDNSFGQLGNGTTGGPDGPGGEWGYDTPQVATGITDAAKVASNGDAFCALLTSGRLECWGANGAGQLGNGELSGPDQCVGAPACYDTPQPVTTVTDATQVVGTSDNTAGGFCAVLVTGGVDCWGQNDDGQLGIGIVGGPTPKSPTAFDTPQAVGITNARSIVSGVGSYCVVLLTGGVDCWGMDSVGQIGNGNAPPNDGDGLYGFDTPQPVTGITDSVSVASDGPGYCALLSSGALECWGDNSYGQLGNGVVGGNGSDGPYSDDTPQQVADITNATAVFGQTGSYCAILSSGKTKCWGDNVDGQLGNGTTGGPDQDSDYDTPQTVVGIVEAASGTSLSNWPQSAYCLALSTGGVDCWGDNTFGQLGNGTIGGPTGENGNNAYNEPQAVLTS